MLAQLDFQVLNVRVERYAAQPTLTFRLRIGERTGASIQSINLKCQVRIEPQKVAYTREQQSRLFGLFSDVSRWDSTLKPFLWTHVTAVTNGFQGETEIDLAVPVSYDLEVAAGKYLHAVRGADVPLLFLFSGTIFVDGPEGLSIQPVSWDCEAEFALPGDTWEALMDLYFPNSGWLRLERETLDRLEDYKARNALPTWDATLRALLETTEGRVTT